MVGGSRSWAASSASTSRTRRAPSSKPSRDPCSSLYSDAPTDRERVSYLKITCLVYLQLGCSSLFSRTSLSLTCSFQPAPSALAMDSSPGLKALAPPGLAMGSSTGLRAPLTFLALLAARLLPLLYVLSPAPALVTQTISVGLWMMNKSAFA